MNGALCITTQFHWSTLDPRFHGSYSMSRYVVPFPSVGRLLESAGVCWRIVDVSFFVP